MGRLIQIDLQPLIAATLNSLPSGPDQTRILKGAGAAAIFYWRQIAQKTLSSTARDYIAGLQYAETDKKVTITLNGAMPNHVEQGMAPYDMRQTLLYGPKAKISKDGSRYATIPFRHGTPKTGGRNVGRPMPKAIHNSAKKLLATLSRPGAPVKSGKAGMTLWGERLTKKNAAKAARKILEKRDQPWHKSSIYEGMIRKAKPAATKSGSQTTGYMTFRRISTNSDPAAWRHPGIKARRLANKVQEYIEVMADGIIQAAMENGNA